MPQFLGIGRSMIADMVDRGLLHPFNLSGRGRSKVVLEREVAELQQKQFARAKAQAPRDDETEADEHAPRQRLRSRSEVGARR